MATIASVHPDETAVRTADAALGGGRWNCLLEFLRTWQQDKLSRWFLLMPN
jgi:hypothetical protein